MEANELENGLAFFGVKVQASKERVSELYALSGMLAGPACLARVV
jgi:hypothetical protein